MAGDGYEIDFIRAAEGSKNCDAIAIRTFVGGKIQVVTIDGGTEDTAKSLVAHMDAHYKTRDVVCAVCTHTDQDHSSGVRYILENCNVGAVVVNRPWEHADEIFKVVQDGRITIESLKQQLRKAYPMVDEIEKISISKGIRIFDGFQGLRIGEFFVASPTKEHYLKCIMESNKTPDTILEGLVAGLEKMVEKVKDFVFEVWDKDNLRSDAEVSSENEASIVLYGEPCSRPTLLTADAGPEALGVAYDYMSSHGYISGRLKFIQIPHHGSRHNVTPEILSKLLGDIVEQGDTSVRGSAFASTAIKADNYPRPAVRNAFIRRGYKVVEGDNGGIRHSHNMPHREGWVAVGHYVFADKSERWEC